MKKYLVISDIHGRETKLEAVLEKNKDVSCVIVCGDIEIETYNLEQIIQRHLSPSIDIRMVRGNCDIYYSTSSRILDLIAFPVSSTHRAMVTHGHLYGRARMDLLAYAAKEKECDTVFYGHIHQQVDETMFGVRFLNPGALRNGEYMTVITDDNGELLVTHLSL